MVTIAMKLKFLSFGVILACIFIQPALAADFSYEKSGDKQLILVVGKIVPGDSVAMIHAIKAATLRESAPIVLSVDSLGGDVTEALRLAEIIEKLALPVTLRGRCVSACFFIFASGVGRFSGKYDVGLHRPFLVSPQQTEESLKSQKHSIVAIREYFSKKNIPSYLIDLMMSRPSTDIYWLTVGDIELLGNYPPEFEELFIAKCGYNRKITGMMIDAEISGNSQLGRQYWEQLDRTDACIDRISAQIFQRNLPALYKKYSGLRK